MGGQSGSIDISSHVNQLDVKNFFSKKTSHAAAEICFGQPERGSGLAGQCRPQRLTSPGCPFVRVRPTHHSGSCSGQKRPTPARAPALLCRGAWLPLLPSLHTASPARAPESPGLVRRRKPKRSWHGRCLRAAQHPIRTVLRFVTWLWMLCVVLLGTFIDFSF